MKLTDLIQQTKKLVPTSRFFRDHYPDHFYENGNCRCPFHDDDKDPRKNGRSLQIDEKFAYCHGCETKKDVIDLCQEFYSLSTAKEACDKLIEEYSLQINEPKTKFKDRIVEIDDYKDENGVVLSQKVRLKDPKDFRQRPPDPKPGESWSIKGIRVVLFRLPELLEHQDRPIWLVEGEKDVKNLAKCGFLATTSPTKGGWTKWVETWNFHEPLRDRDVIICPDYDKIDKKLGYRVGWRYAEEVAQTLIGFSKSVKLVLLPDISEGQDISDFIELHGADKATELLLKLVENADVLTEPPQLTKAKPGFEKEKQSQSRRPLEARPSLSDEDEQALCDKIVQGIEDIPADTPPLALSDKLKPLLQDLTALPEGKSEVILTRTIKDRFGLKFNEVNAYRRQLRSQSSETEMSDLPTGKLFRPLPYVKKILATYRVICVGGDFLYWSKEDGYYRRWPAEQITGLLIQWVGDKIRTAYIREIKELLAELTTKNQEELRPPDLVCLKNKILNYETGDLLDHTPDLYFTSQFPVDFDPNAKSENYDAFLSRALADPKEQNLWHEAGGYTFCRDTRYQVAFLLMDDDIGSTGKSTLVEILQRILGAWNYSTIRLAELASKFKLADLTGKHANTSSEVNVKEFLDDSIVKQLISGEELLVEQKYKPPHPLRNFAKLFVTANRFPNTYDCGNPFHRRWIVLKFQHRFPRQGEPGNIPRFAYTLSQAELNAVFVKMVEGLKRLHSNKGFTLPESTIAAKEEFRRATNPVADFAHECLTLTDRQSGICLKDCHDEYKRWYEENIGGTKWLRKRRFRRDLEATVGRDFCEDPATHARILRGVFIRTQEDRYEV